MNSLPKRRRKKGNPYTLLFEPESNKYYVLFKDSRGILNKVEVSNIIFNAFNRFELDDISELHKIDKHLDMNPLDEEKLYKNDNESLDDYIIRKATYEDLMSAINTLPDIQKRRIKKYYFEEKTQQQIANEEGCNIRSVQYTLNIAIKNLKNLLK